MYLRNVGLRAKKLDSYIGHLHILFIESNEVIIILKFIEL